VICECSVNPVIIQTLSVITLSCNGINKIIKHPAPKKQSTDTDPQHWKTKWATYIYGGKETRKITKLF
jgi:hypothetical protein